MKNRMIDTFSVESKRRNTDDAWLAFSHYLVTAFGDPLIQEGKSTGEVEQIYCEQRARSLDQKTLDGLIYTLPPAFLHLKDERHAPADVHWGASPNTPFILLGHVGTGKSTFLDYMFLFKLPKENPNIKAIIVNYLKAEDSHEDFSRYLFVRVNSELGKMDKNLAVMNSDLMENLFAEEIASYKATLQTVAQQQKISELFSIYVDAHLPGKEIHFKELIKRKIKLLRQKGLEIWIILDNVDQHHACLQNDALMAAVSTSSTFKCHLIIAMRYISLTTPAAGNIISSYRPRKLKLSLPNTAMLLKKRLEYFERISSHILEEPLKWTGYQLTVSDLLADIKRTIDLLTESGFLEKNLLPLANYNMRRVLDIVLSIFQSYYFFHDRFNNQRYVPSKATLIKRFLYAHLLKNEDYFGIERDENESFILNLFENENKTCSCNQTIRIRLLQGLRSIGKTTTLKELTSLLLTTFNYEDYDLLQAYRTFLKLELFALKGNQAEAIFHDGFESKHMREEIQVSLTYAGEFHYGLLRRMEYIEIMKFSTYIIDELSHPIQHEKFNTTVNERINSNKKFVKYITGEERKEFESAVLDKEKFSAYFGYIGPLIQQAVDDGAAEISHT